MSSKEAEEVCTKCGKRLRGKMSDLDAVVDYLLKEMSIYKNIPSPWPGASQNFTPREASRFYTLKHTLEFVQELKKSAGR